MCTSVQCTRRACMDPRTCGPSTSRQRRRQQNGLLLEFVCFSAYNILSWNKYSIIYCILAIFVTLIAVHTTLITYHYLYLTDIQCSISHVSVQLCAVEKQRHDLCNNQKTNKKKFSKTEMLRYEASTLLINS